MPRDLADRTADILLGAIGALTWVAAIMVAVRCCN